MMLRTATFALKQALSKINDHFDLLLKPVIDRQTDRQSIILFIDSKKKSLFVTKCINHSYIYSFLCYLLYNYSICGPCSF